MAGGIDTADIAYAYGTPVEAAAMGANEGFAASAFYSALRAIRKGKTGGCSGDCAHCGSSCGRDGCGK